MDIKMESDVEEYAEYPIEYLYDEDIVQPKFVLQNDSTEISTKSICCWSNTESKILLHKYAEKIHKIGPLKQYKNKKAMWAAIADVIGNKTWTQCEQRFKTIMRRKKKPVDSNKTNAVKRMALEYPVDYPDDEDTSQPNDSTENLTKIICFWSNAESKILLEKYAENINKIGPLKEYKNKKVMWAAIADIFGNKTWLQCEQRFKTIMRRKQKAVDNKRPSATKWKAVEYLDDEDIAQPKFVQQNSTMNSTKNICYWSNSETKVLLDKYAENINKIGPFKQYKNKKAMWTAIADIIGNKTWLQCEQRFKTIMRRKKKPVGYNKNSVSKRKAMVFEEELLKINRIDDSIEPDVQLSSEELETNNSERLPRIPKNRTKTLTEVLLEIDENKRRRHQERMTEARELRKLMEQLVNK